MGTRNLTCVVLDGEFRIAQYGQFDGYPRGQGETVLKFLRNWNRETFIENLRKTSWMSDEKINKIWEDGGSVNGMIACGKADLIGHQYPQLNRGTGAKILQMIQFGEVKELDNQIGFAADSLFCEWAYVIDLDKNVLEVYVGFNKRGLEKNARFAFLKEACKDTVYYGKAREYYPIRLRKSYSLDNLPTVEQMAKDCK